LTFCFELLSYRCAAKHCVGCVGKRVCGWVTPKKALTSRQRFFLLFSAKELGITRRNQACATKRPLFFRNDLTMKTKTLPFEETPVAFRSQGRQLVGIWHHGQSKKVVIFCHGFTGSKVESKRIFVEAGRVFAEEGVDAFRFDFFGSGDSEGDFADSSISTNLANLRDAIAWIEQKGYEDIALLGLSMGGAAVILAANEQPIKAIVAWSAVPDMNQLFSSVVQNWQNQAESTQVFEYEGWLIKNSFWQDALQYDIQKAFSQITLPKLVVQGTADSAVFINGFQSFREVALPPADFMEIPGGGHTFPSPGHRRQVIRQTLIWLKRHF
jgi:uncharacterized protein